MDPTPGLSALFPPHGLVIRAGSLTLRVLTDADLPEYAELIRRPTGAEAGGEYGCAWCAGDPAQRVREAGRCRGRLRAELSAEQWTLPFGIWADGRLIGCQDAMATRFAQRKAIDSG